MHLKMSSAKCLILNVLKLPIRSLDLSRHFISVNSLGPSDAYVSGSAAIIGSNNGLSPNWRRAIIWTNVRTLLIRSLGTNLSEILIKIHIFSLKKMHLKISSGKWRPFCLGHNVLIWYCLKGDAIDIIHKSQNAPVPYPTMLHSEQKCAHFCSEWSIVGYVTGALWDLWNWSICDQWLCHQELVITVMPYPVT